MTISSERHGTRILLLLTVVILGLVPVASGGFFTIDEVIYLLGAKTLATTGHLGIVNGYSAYGSKALKLLFLVWGPSGLVPQYPIGTTLTGAPLYLLFGNHGLILLNAAAVAGTLFATRALARSLYADENTALLAPLLLIFGTYTLEYAYGIWPHGVTIFCVVTALWLVVRALDTSKRESWLSGCGAGLLIGTGFLFRLDTVLILPTIAACIILFAKRPVGLFLGGMAGTLPGIAVAAIANVVKFGSPNPLSYGAAPGGGTDPTTYLNFAALLAALFIPLIALRVCGLSVLRRYWRLILSVGAGLVLALLLIPAVRHELVAVVRGFYVLVIDIRPINDPRHGIVTSPFGTVSFWGLDKKALGQSLPWLAIILALFVRPWRVAEWRSHAILLGGAFLWILPFLPTQWYGGFASNMRYFLPILPLLATLAARVWLSALEGGRIRHIWVVCCLTAGVALVVGWAFFLPSGVAGSQQILTTRTLAVMAVAALASYLPGAYGAGARVVTRYVFLVALGIALCLGPVIDLAYDERIRVNYARMGEQMERLPGPSLVIGPPVMTARLIGRPGYLVAVRDPLSDKVDANLVDHVLRNGDRVFVFDSWVPGLLGADPTLSVAASKPLGVPEMTEIREASP